MENIEKLLKGFGGGSIAVVGDVCLDLYYFLSGEISEKSVETGLETRSVSGFRHEPGGAGNVAVNLKRLGAGSVDLYGVMGDDPYGKILGELLAGAGVNCDFVRVQKEDWNTHVYHKILQDGREKPRYDLGNFNKAADTTNAALLSDLESNIGKYQAVIINQQVLKGYHNAFFQKSLNALIHRQESECLWISDCRHLNDSYDHCIRKLNNIEARDVYNRYNGREASHCDDSEIALWLGKHWNRPVYITRGENGALCVDSDGTVTEVRGINLIGAGDPVGAGDAFLSGMALTLATGGDAEEALRLGNFSAAVSVTKLHETGHPEPDEVLKMSASPDYRYNPELAENPYMAVYLDNTPIELIKARSLPLPKIAIFDHDGTISTLRQGWEPIMQQFMVESIIGGSPGEAGPDTLKKVNDIVAETINRTTGVQTIVQMDILRKLVLSSGLVREESVRTIDEYKAIYNERLMEMVSSRVSLFRKGHLDLRDLTIKGAVPFLKRLRENGVTLYLASGTDQEDVRKEASVLGYAQYFNGGIFGSVGDVNCDPKRMVIGKIIESLPPRSRPGECYVFGDGPVEIREAAKKGFTGIGLISDEKRRFGPDMKKRSRLVLGGAGVLLPDFSWAETLADHFDWRLK